MREDDHDDRPGHHRADDDGGADHNGGDHDHAATTTGSTTTPGATTTTTVQPPAGGFNRSGYFLQWRDLRESIFPRDLVTPQAANRLTHVNYAFKNIDPVNLTCLNGVTRATTANLENPQSDGA